MKNEVFCKKTNTTVYSHLDNTKLTVTISAVTEKEGNKVPLNLEGFFHQIFEISSVIKSHKEFLKGITSSELIVTDGKLNKILFTTTGVFTTEIARCFIKEFDSDSVTLTID